MAEETKKNYPQLPSRVWWNLRTRLVAAPSATVTPTFAATVLGVDEKAAEAYIRSFRDLGILDENGRLTELGQQWRLDNKYADACELILNNVYEEELLHVAPPPKPDRGTVSSWFMATAGLGSGSAGNKAALYLLLAEGDPTGGANSNESGNKNRYSQRKQVSKKQQSGQSQKESPKPKETTKNDGSTGKATFEKAVQLNVQIHIAPETTAEQIDAIFSSMAKYLNG